jgi:hypothetical protein
MEIGAAGKDGYFFMCNDAAVLVQAREVVSAVL